MTMTHGHRRNYTTLTDATHISTGKGIPNDSVRVETALKSAEF
jgi:hypothetical protein